ncbi:polyprenol-phosphate-mannose-dependent alpha-(1-2)-phosphatidylinositol pentamannoside mannosyltransferase [Mycolicibacterium litorale]|uniref:Polyprenol-phosphate-mannose-dependent alpha-(1-2)-phosphatidylinositol pentamannoside mannosyltransferase n=1 Tax=Mycolicibacterium litorale TaxID=758802 RepID=A0AAD1IHP7_9MYCO|nr:polyprenol-phosphate-mannose-dependent alpha-(1-2)-phosphatidylinositol pentamannoside mannosyltransferase [Mycolicibacterium litorale]
MTGIGYRISRVGLIDTFTASAATSARLPGRLAAAAPVLLVLSIAARLAWTYLVANGANFVDLHVYVGGAAALDEPGTLYDYVYADQTPDFPLPFTYPPFAAVLFYPLHLLPFGVVAFAWQVGIIAALYAVVRLSQRLLGDSGDRRTAMVWTAIGIWLEPLRSTFDYGQVNVLLVLAVLAAVHSSRWWLSGLLVGLAAGVKLTPAVSGLYFVGARRWSAAIFSAVVFAATVAVSVAVVGEQARFYFTDLLGDADRVGPIGTSFNQSWRGGISRILGYDAGYGVLVVAGIVVTAVLALLAWRAIGGSADRLGAILIVQLFGLLLSPISWTHHWVWILPLMIWLWHGPLRQRTGARVLRWGWLALTLVGVPWLLSFAQPTIWEIGRPWYLAWAGLIYIVATLATLAWVAATGATGRGWRRSPAPSADPSP